MPDPAMAAGGITIAGSFHLGDTQETDLAWAYPDPIPACAAIKDHIAFYWGRMDVWFVGDKPVSAPPA